MTTQKYECSLHGAVADGVHQILLSRLEATMHKYSCKFHVILAIPEQGKLGVKFNSVIFRLIYC